MQERYIQYFPKFLRKAYLDYAFHKYLNVDYGYGLPSSVVHKGYYDKLIIDLPLSQIRGHIDKNIQIQETSIKPKYHFVVNGDWHKQSIPLKDDETYRNIRDLINNPSCLKSLSLYKKYIHMLKSGKPQIHGNNYLDTYDKVETYFMSHLQLFETIKYEGYKPMYPEYSDVEREIGVCIDRHGHFYHFKTGHHRIAIADILGLDTVPVFIHFIDFRLFNNPIYQSDNFDNLIGSLKNTVSDPVV